MAVGASKAEAGHSAGRAPARHISLASKSGLAQIIVSTLGATLVSCKVRDETKPSAQLQECVLGFPHHPHMYLEEDNPYFGATIGPCANRISGGAFELDGQDGTRQTFSVPRNEKNVSCLHSGPDGYHQRLFSANEVETGPDGQQSLLLTLRDDHLHGGFPGDVIFSATYTLSESQHGGRLCANVSIEYSASVTSSRAAVMSPTNHSYWNISGNLTTKDTRICLATCQQLEFDDNSCPTGNIIQSPFVAMRHGDSSEVVTLHAREPAIDNCFVLRTTTPYDTRAEALRPFAHAYHPNTDLHLLAATTEPAFQFYSGDGVDVHRQDLGLHFPARAGFCLEAGRFTDAINHEPWRDQVILRQQKPFGSRTMYSLWFGTDDIDLSL